MCTRWDNLDVSTIISGQIFTVSSVSAVKGYPSGALVDLSGPIVTGVFDGFFYIEDRNRASGIKIVSTCKASVGDYVRVVGTLVSINGEKCINASQLQTVPTWQPILPMGIIGRSVGSTAGLSNVGLLATIWGRVTSINPDEDYCYIDDGSGVCYEHGIAGIIVAFAGSRRPVCGDFLSCTGVISMTSDSAPVLCMRTDNDFVIHSLKQ